MPEPTFNVSLTREQALAMLKDAQSSHFPTLDSDDDTVRFFNELREWYKGTTVSYTPQIRSSEEGSDWRTIGSMGSPDEAAWLLHRSLQRHGFYLDEMHARHAELAEGHVLTADDFTEFRIVREGEETL